MNYGFFVKFLAGFLNLVGHEIWVAHLLMCECNECSNPQGWQCREDPVWLAAPQPLSRGTRHGLATWTHQAELLWEYTIPPTQKQMLLLLAMTTMAMLKTEHHHQHTPHFPNPSSTPLCWKHKPWCTDAQPWNVIAFSVASGKRSRGDLPPTRTKTKKNLSADFVSKLPNQPWTPNKLSAQSGRRGASPPVWD